MNLFILIFSIAISLCCFWYGLKLILLYVKVKKWSLIEASVVSKRTELHPKTSTRSAYAVRVEYDYQYGPTNYHNNKVYLAELIKGQVNHRESSAQKIVDEIKNTVLVYVNPENPQQSVIFCKGIGLYIFVFLMGFVSLLMGWAYYQ